MKTIHNALDEYACGSLTYSEGINDDINKFIWGDQDWDPGTSVIETLRDYCRFFISPDFSDDLAQGFMAQERNWEGPLAVNDQVAPISRNEMSGDPKRSFPNHPRQSRPTTAYPKRRAGIRTLSDSAVSGCGAEALMTSRIWRVGFCVTVLVTGT